MRLGKEAMEALQAEVTGRLLPGQELVMIGTAALKGTSLLAEWEYEALRKIFSEGFLKNTINLYRETGIKEGSRAWEMLLAAKPSAVFAMGEGGFLCGLWKMAEASGVGLCADFRRIPIRQETIEVCEVFDLNPYRLQAEGAVLAGLPSGEALVQELIRAGIPAAVIGQTNRGNDRLLYSGENVRYLDRPTEDEIEKIRVRRKDALCR